ncbi:hypothetical protein MD588_10745 [Photobacterium sp. SDRW27]|uniref:hypothetical protein n=1 Tax=Photobacterium obscurum TaxID=2829490 RepID=UPI002244D390|nr:hypothetical protein [Photobacterium obscurum]MCW8329283.1 hypothetical protein [Photobacterium obscurum]
MNKQTNNGAPGWVLPLLIMVLLTMQLSVKAEDIKDQKIDILHGETLRAWNELDGVASKECQ